MSWRYETYLPFRAYGGREYVLHIGYDEHAAGIGGLPEGLEEDSHGNIHPIGAGGPHFDSLAEFTQHYRCEILRWGNEFGN